MPNSVEGQSLCRLGKRASAESYVELLKDRWCETGAEVMAHETEVDEVTFAQQGLQGCAADI